MENKHRISKESVCCMLMICAVWMTVVIYDSGRAVGNDGFWHMAFGRWMYQHKAVPFYAIGAWGGEKLPWVPQEWLFQFLMYFTCRDNMNLAWWITSILFLGCFLLIAVKSGLMKDVSHHMAGFGIFLYCFIFAGLFFMVPRPQIVSMMFLVLYCLLLEKMTYEEKVPVKQWIELVFLCILWANVHAGTMILSYLIPIGVIFCFKLSEKIPAIRNKFDCRIPAKYDTRYSVAALLAIASAFCTPNGLKGFLYPMQSMGDDLMLEVVREWQMPDFNDVSGFLAFWIPFIVFLLFLIFLKNQKMKLYDAALLVLMFLLGLMHLRFCLFMCVIFPLYIIRYCPENKGSSVRIKPMAGMALSVICVLIGSMMAPQVTFASEGYGQTKFFDTVRAEEGERPYTYYDIGGMMQYYNVPVFVDARYDPFSSDRMKDVVTLNYSDSRSKEFNDVMKKWDFTSFTALDHSAVLLWAKDHGYHKVCEFDTGETRTDKVGRESPVKYEFWIKD